MADKTYKMTITLSNDDTIDAGTFTAPQGPQGEKGDTGAQGPQGPQGDQGETGSSVFMADTLYKNWQATISRSTLYPSNVPIYENALIIWASGQCSRITSFNANTVNSSLLDTMNLKGPQGATGPQGERGPQGPQGVSVLRVSTTYPNYQNTVPKAYVYPNNATLYEGALMIWASGECSQLTKFTDDTITSLYLTNMNLKGPQGETGATGERGPQGPQGAKGDTGAQGPQGAKGDTGTQGPQGAKGDTGARGPQGVSITSVMITEVN